MPWLPDAQNLRCPTCSAQLETRGGSLQGVVDPDPLIDSNDDRRCPAGHQLPDLDELYRWRDEHGHASG